MKAKSCDVYNKLKELGAGIGTWLRDEDGEMRCIGYIAPEGFVARKARQVGSVGDVDYFQHTTSIIEAPTHVWVPLESGGGIGLADFSESPDFFNSLTHTCIKFAYPPTETPEQKEIREIEERMRGDADSLRKLREGK